MTRTLLIIAAAMALAVMWPVIGLSVLWIVGGLAFFAAATIAGPVIQAVELAFRERISFREAWKKGAE